MEERISADNLERLFPKAGEIFNKKLIESQEEVIEKLIREISLLEVRIKVLEKILDWGLDKIHKGVMSVKNNPERKIEDFVMRKNKKSSKFETDYRHNICKCGRVKMKEAPKCRKCFLRDLSKYGRKTESKK